MVAFSHDDDDYNFLGSQLHDLGFWIFFFLLVEGPIRKSESVFL